MATSLDADVRPIIPDDIARIVIAPKSYTDDATIYGAFKWLRDHMPLGIAQVPGYDPIWRRMLSRGRSMAGRCAYCRR